jgi:hypothetical protein
MTDLEALNLLIATGDKVTSARLDYLQQTLGINKLFLSEEFNQLKQGLRYLRDNSGFDPSTADLSEFLNENADPYVRESGLPNFKRKQTFSKDVYFAPVTGQDNIWFAPNYNGLIGTFGGINFNVNTLTSNLSVVRNNGLAPIVTVPYDCKVTNVFLDTIFGRQHLLEYGLIKFKRLNGGSSDLNVAINNLPIGVFPANGGVVMGNITAHQDNYDVSNSPIIYKNEQIIPLIRRVSGALLNYVGVITITIEEI